MRKSSLVFGTLRVPLDAALIIAAFIIAYEMRRQEIFPFDFLGVHLGGGPLDPLADYLYFAAAATLGLIVLLALSGQYNLQNQFRPFRQLIRTGVAVSAWMMLIIAYFFITRELFFSRAVMAYTWVLAIIFVWLGRFALAFLENIWMHFSREKFKILFIGAGEISRQLARELEKDPRYEVAGALVMSSDERKDARLKVLGTFSDLEKAHEKYGIREIFQVSGELDKKKMAELLAFCRDNQIEFRFLPSILEIHSKNIDLETLRGLPIVYLKPSRLDGWGRVLKRVFDIFGSLLGIVILSPLLLVLVVLVKATSRGPALYCDYRAGKNKEKFVFCKFRSMYADMCSGELYGNKKGDDLRQKLAESKDNMRRGTPMVKIKNDPRVTPLGAFLRKTSLDELPNLFHVLRGKMSLVGPRPHLPEEVEHYKSYHKRVFAVKPGITGAAQVSGRSDLDFDEEVRLDLAYIENWSLMLDIVILIKTVGVILLRRHKE